MAFPSVASVVAGGTGGTNTSPVTIPIQSGSDGDLIVVIFSQDATPTMAVDIAYSGNNWKSLGRTVYSTIVESNVFWKQADGGDLLRLTMGYADQSTWIVYRIVGGYTLSGSVTTSSSTDADPPAHTPPDGVQDYLWIVARAGDSTVVATAAPSGYGSLISQQGGTQGASVNSAVRTATAASEDPGAFTNVVEQQVVWTLAASPAKKLSVGVIEKSTVTATPKINRKNQVIVAAQSSMIATPTRVKIGLTAIHAASAITVNRDAIHINSITDESSSPILDHNRDSIVGIKSPLFRVATAIFTSSSLAISFTRIQRRAVAISATSAFVVTRKKIVHRVVHSTGTSTITVAKKIKRRGIVAIHAASHLSTVGRVGNTTRQRVDVAALSSLAVARKITRRSAAAVSAKSTLVAGKRVISIRSLQMTLSSIVSGIRVADLERASATAAVSLFVATPIAIRRRTAAIRSSSGVTITSHIHRSRIAVVASRSTIVAAGIRLRLVATVVAGKSVLTATPKVILHSTGRRAKPSKSANAGEIKGLIHG